MTYDSKFDVVDVVGCIDLYYDGQVWQGSFDSFDLKESNDNPYRFTYSFVFVGRGINNTANMLGHYNIGSPR